MTPSDQTKRSTPKVDLTDVTTLGVLAALSAIAFFMAGQYGDDTPSGGNVFPQLASGVVCVTACVSLIQRLRGKSPNTSASDEDIKITWKPVSVALLTFGFLVLLPIIGYPLLAPLWLAAVMWVFGMRSVWILGFVSIGLSALAWILLSRLAFAPPPAGLFERFL